MELVDDVAVRITPLADGDARDMVRSLHLPAPRRLWAAVAAPEDLLERISGLVEAHRQIAELCKPVIVTETGATVVDVRTRVQPVPARPPSPSVDG